MSITKTEYREYVLGMVDDRQRQERQHHHQKAGFVHIIEQVLEEYELAPRLAAAKTDERAKLKILDVGCGEGLYLHDIAQVLEGRGLAQIASLYGIDINQAMIETAIEYTRLSKPPRPYLTFYLHDIRQPLQSQRGLFADGQPHFDFIYARIVLSLVSQARENLERLYASLAPGGVLYVRDLILGPDEAAVISPHPALAKITNLGFGLLKELNQGVQVATATAEWLRQAGASLVQAMPDKMILGGTSKAGMDNLNDYLAGVRASIPLFVGQRLISQNEVDCLMAQLYRELGPSCQGHQLYIDTLARKPA